MSNDLYGLSMGMTGAWLHAFGNLPVVHYWLRRFSAWSRIVRGAYLSILVWKLSVPGLVARDLWIAIWSSASVNSRLYLLFIWLLISAMVNVGAGFEFKMLVNCIAKVSSIFEFFENVTSFSALFAKINEIISGRMSTKYSKNFLSGLDSSGTVY
ncbi:hypothetical protein PGB90_001056 [Kerria lacca]